MLVARTGDEFIFVGDNAVVVNDGESAETTLAIGDVGASISETALSGKAFEFKQVAIEQPDSGNLIGNTPAQVVISKAVDVRPYLTADLTGEVVLRGMLNEAGTTITMDGPVVIDIAALGTVASSVKSVTVQRNVAIDVIRRKSGGAPGEGEPIFQTGVLSLDSSAANYIANVLTQTPEKKLDALTLPMAASVTGTPDAATLYSALLAMFSNDSSDGKVSLLNPAFTAFEEPRFVIALTGGTDGDMPSAIDYSGETDNKGSTGFAALEEIDDIAIVLTPAAVISADHHQAIVNVMASHCAKMRYRMGLVDSRQDMSISEMRSFRDNFDDSRLALYGPWVVTNDPTGERLTISLPPSGYMAGIYARTRCEPWRAQSTGEYRGKWRAAFSPKHQ